jgi:hypothetical protein
MVLGTSWGTSFGDPAVIHAPTVLPVPTIPTKHGVLGASSEWSPQTVLRANWGASSGAPAMVHAPAVPAEATIPTTHDVLGAFAEGYDLYWSGRYSEARSRLQAATAGKSADARALYYLGLTEMALGDWSSAAVSIDRAAQIHALANSHAREISLALTRVQGSTRQVLDGALARARAGEINVSPSLVRRSSSRER